MKEKHFYYFKEWIVIPFAVVLHTNCLEYYPPAKRLEVHLLCWHWKWTFHKKE